ncbi:MAG: phosphopyruvate hydratase [Dehalococcoidia bacterium]
MDKITDITAREILDSRGNPTIEATVVLSSGNTGTAAVPSGASTGKREAVELRDGDKNRFSGKGVLNAVENINEKIRNLLTNLDPLKQKKIDNIMIDFDNTENKSNLGANSILAVSLATMKSASKSLKIPLYKYINQLYDSNNEISLPVPMMNILNGGAHAEGSTDFQEIMIAPIGFNNFNEALRCGVEIYHVLKNNLKKNNHVTTVGDEGGFAPQNLTNSEAINYVAESIKDAGYNPGKDVYIALDVAASEFYTNNKYHLSRENKILTSKSLVKEYEKLCEEYPIYSIEDGLSEDDWDGWANLTKTLGDNVQLVGDDLFVTQEKYLKRGIDNKSANSILIKLNQVGTVSETLSTIKLAKQSNFSCIISHRSGETEDTTISDFAVGVSSGQIKTGAPNRSERVAKYNRLLSIEEIIGDNKYLGKNIL